MWRPTTRLPEVWLSTRGNIDATDSRKEIGWSFDNY